jgi:hypothetical protein
VQLVLSVASKELAMRSPRRSAPSLVLFLALSLAVPPGARGETLSSSTRPEPRLISLQGALPAGDGPVAAPFTEAERSALVRARAEALSRPVDKTSGEPRTLGSPDESGGDDVLIAAHTDMEQGHSFDIAENGDLYVAVEIRTSGGPEIRVYRSQDGGDTWVLWGTKSDADPNIEYRQPSIHVAEGDRDSVYLAYQKWIIDPNDDRDIWVSSSPLGASATWSDRNVMDQPGVHFNFPDLTSDAEVNGAYRLFLVATGAEAVVGDDVWFASSTPLGASWNPEFIYWSQPNFDMWYPRVRYGKGGVVHTVCEQKFHGGTFVETVTYRRAYNFGATYPDFADTTWFMTTTGDAYRETDPQIAASHVSDRVVITYTKKDSTNFSVQPARVLASSTAGFTWADTGEDLGQIQAQTALVALPGTAGFRSVGGWFQDGGVGAQSAGDATPKVWSAMSFLSDRVYANTHYAEPALDYDATHGNQVGVIFKVLHGEIGGVDSLMFDAEWRDAPGYPNLEPGFPVALPYDVISPPAICELDGDAESEIVLGDAGGNIRAYHHDGSVVAGWPIDIGDIAPDSPVAVGDLDGDGEYEVVCGNTAGQVYAFHADGTAVAGWPVFVNSSSAFVSIGSLLSIPGQKQVVAVAGQKETLLLANGSVAPGWPLTRVGATTASPAIGDVDGDGDREMVATFGGIVFVNRADATLQSSRDLGVAGKTFSNSVSLGDLNLDGDLEIVAPTDQGDVYVLNPDGTNLTGWPYVDPSGTRITSVALANARSTGEPELGFAVESASVRTVHARTAANVELSGYPHQTGAGWYLFGAPIWDVLDEGSSDLVIGSRDGLGWSWDNFGTELPGWPKTLGKSHVSPASGDLDQDGDLEIVFATVEDPKLFILDVGAAATRQPSRRTWFWPMYGYNAQRTACLACGIDAVVGVDGTPIGSLDFAAPWPNPASGASSFRFSLPVGGPVRLELFDVSGRRVRELAKQEMSAGIHELSWDGRDADGVHAASGVYFARLSWAGARGEEVAVRRLTRIR